MRVESSRVRAMQDPVIPLVAEKIAQNPGTISLGQGVVWYPPPESVVAAVETFFQNPNNHKYQMVIGNADLHERIREKLQRENGFSGEDGASVAVTSGGNMAFVNALLAIADPGDEIIFSRPFYFNQEMAVVMAGCRPVIVDTDANYQLRLDAIEAAITPRTRAIVTISPNNPTGAVYPEASLRAVNALCERHGVYHIHDEAYEYFSYDTPHFSPCSISGAAGHTISIFSLSKAYGFASWRIGYMVAPTPLLMGIKKVQDTIQICPTGVSQFAATRALGEGRAWCEPRIAEIRQARETATQLLAPLRDRCVIPDSQGAFYFFIHVGAKLTAMQITERLIEEHRVAVMPGSTFGANTGCAIRISYGALRKETIAEGVGRLVEGLQAILRKERI